MARMTNSCFVPLEKKGFAGATTQTTKDGVALAQAPFSKSAALTIPSKDARLAEIALAL